MDNRLSPGDAFWTAFHASLQSQEARDISLTTQLPLFMDTAHAVAMIRHSNDVVTKAVYYLNPGQITFDQPVFTLAKQIWWPESYDEDKLVVMFGGLHIEMAALKMLGDWLQGRGNVNALVQAQIQC